MSNLKSGSKYIKIAETAFLYIFMLYAILGNNVFSYGEKIISFVMWPTFILGGFVVACRIIKYKTYYTMPGLWALVLMIISIGVSTLVNYNYSFKSNVIQCIYWVFYFIVLYTVRSDEDHNKSKKDLSLFLVFFVVYTTLEVIGSFLTFIFNYSGKIIEPNGYEYYIGFSIGRLWGTFINPNTGAVLAVAAIIILVYFFTKTKKVLVKIAYALLILLNYFYVVFSDSRTGAVCLGVVSGVYFLVIVLYKLRNKKSIIKGLTIVLSAIICVTFVSLPRKTTTLYNNIAVLITSDGNFDDKDLNVIDRGYDLSSDISNRRFDVWKGASQLYVDSTKTFTVGCSYGGFTQYTIENQPDNYLVNNDYGIFTTLDNEFFNIMCSQGTLGLLTTIIFVGFIVVFIFKRTFKLRDDDKDDIPTIALCLALIIGLVASAMFRSVMFYHLSPATILFWFVLGRFVYILNRKSKVN